MGKLTEKYITEYIAEIDLCDNDENAIEVKAQFIKSYDVETNQWSAQYDDTFIENLDVNTLDIEKIGEKWDLVEEIMIDKIDNLDNQELAGLISLKAL